jgi:hypothetical protein
MLPSAVMKLQLCELINVNPQFVPRWKKDDNVNSMTICKHPFFSFDSWNSNLESIQTVVLLRSSILKWWLTQNLKQTVEKFKVRQEIRWHF